MTNKMTTHTLIQSYTQNFVHSSPHFPFLTFDMMLTTCAIVDDFKFQCGKEVSRSIESCISVMPFDVLGSISVTFIFEQTHCLIFLSSFIELIGAKIYFPARLRIVFLPFFYWEKILTHILRQITSKLNIIQIVFFKLFQRS